MGCTHFLFELLAADSLQSRAATKAYTTIYRGECEPIVHKPDGARLTKRRKREIVTNLYAIFVCWLVCVALKCKIKSRWLKDMQHTHSDRAVE